MLKSFEAVIDNDSNIRTLEPRTLTPGRRAIVVILEEDYAKQPPSDSHAIEDHVKQLPRLGGNIEVTFVHPRDASTMMAEIAYESLTGGDALKELQADDGMGAFLQPLRPGESYRLCLERGDSSIAITPNMTFAQAGVRDGDTIMVEIGGQGAGYSTAYEVVQIIFASTTLLLLFVKALTPIILKLLESKFRIVIRDDTVEIEGYGIRSSNKIIKILEAVVKTKGLRLQEVKDRNALPGSPKIFSLEPAAHEKEKGAQKLRARARAPEARKTAKSSGGKGNKAARKKRPTGKRSA